MPKTAPSVAKSVFFLFRRHPKTGAITGPHGTGFLMARPSKMLSGELHYYAVTNWHTACDLGASIIRLNTFDGGTHFIEFDPSEWHFLKAGDDVAAADLDYLLKPDIDDITHNPEHGFVGEDEISSYEIGPGDDVFMCGLFASHHGGERNVPSMRFGNLSMLADVAAPVELSTGKRRPCHLVDMRSRTGFSGSPVFVYRVPFSDLTKIPSGWIPSKAPGTESVGWWKKEYFMGVLGIHCGQFWDTVEVKKRRKSAEDASDTVKIGDRLLIQSSMTIVVPAWRISELLDLAVFEMARQKRDEEREERWARRPRPEAASEPEEGGD